MANTVDVSFVRAYRSNILRQYAEEGGKLLRMAGQIERSNAETVHFERLLQAPAKDKTVRHAETEIVDSIHSRRTVHLEDKFWADWIDKEDKIKMIADPQSSYVLNGVNALRQAQDLQIYTALRGDALSGKNGATTVALPAGQKVAAAAVGLTFEKVLDSTKILNQNNTPFTNRFAVINSSGLDDLLRETELTSRDFTTMQALQTGMVTNFMGYTWILYNFAAEGSSNFGLFVHQDSLGWAVNQEPMVEVDRLPTRHYLVQVYVSMGSQATRLQEEGVVETEWV